jgi:hypothetical protein
MFSEFAGFAEAESDAGELAIVILLAVEDDYMLALENTWMLRFTYSEGYCRRVESFLMLAGLLMENRTNVGIS